MRQRPLIRRLVVFVMAILVLSLAGLGLLLFRWWGERGAPPTGRLYLSGDFDGDEALVVLTRTGEGNACYGVDTGEETTEQNASIQVCRGNPERVWVDDALLDLSIGARGVPRVSMAGMRLREGDLIGSLADRKRPHPRYPIRAYGVPAKAARVVKCSEEAASDLCLESHDRGGRLAVVRARLGGEKSDYYGIWKLDYGEKRAVQSGDALWLGLVAFEIQIETTADSNQATALVLERVDRLRPRRESAALASAQFGGDRRWLGRLWHVEAPDPGAEVPARFEIHPMHERYTTHNLSRQRTNFEGEDVLQRLIDGGWLCLEKDADEDPKRNRDPTRDRVAWRPLDSPGCAQGQSVPGITRSAVEDYQRARHGDLAFIANSLVNAANAAFGEQRYLEDATALPFTFDWRLAYRRGALKKGQRPQPVPQRLWGVRFGVTRQIRQLASFNRGLLPTVLPRKSTGRHVVQILEGEELVSSVYLPSSANRGSICLGRHVDEEAVGLQATSGRHYPLGSVAFSEGPLSGTWLPNADAECAGCRLALEVNGEAEAKLRIDLDAACEGKATKAENGEVSWGNYRLRAVDRGRPWLAATDPGTQRRHFADEFYLRGSLRPLLGDEAALSGVEAALAEYLSDAGEIGAKKELESLELTLDGDLQLAAAAIVDSLASQHITAKNDREPGRVSVTAVILDGNSGDLLAAVNWSRRGSDRARTNDWAEPTAWEMGSGQADVLENAALLRRGAIGSTMKITGGYALVNNEVLDPGPELTEGRWNVSLLEAGGDRGQLFLQRDIGRPTGRKCSTGPHHLPASGSGYTEETFVRRFAESCNNFFVLSGFRHAGSEPARLSQGRHDPSIRPTVGGDELMMQARDGSAVLVQPKNSEQRLAQRLRDGLAADFSPGSSAPPRSIYSIFFQLGFQPRFDLFARRGQAPAKMAFDHGGQRVNVPLVNNWFAPTGDISTPALEPGRDFAYLGMPSPGRLDKATAPTGERGPRPVLEGYDGENREVWRRQDDGRVDVQYSMLMIGQANIEVSAVGLASLYAPAARKDGRAVSPCIFRANCGAHRQGSQVLASASAEPLNRALRAVVTVNDRQQSGTAVGGLRRVQRRHLTKGWGGKTGTYQRERRDPVGMTRAEWLQLKAWACGVEGLERVPGWIHGKWKHGEAMGSRICEDSREPLNPGGVHGYNSASGPGRLEALARQLERDAAKNIEILHSFVAVAPPRRGGWPEVESPAQGIIVAVLVDRETEDEKSIAVQIAGELAAAVERWATLVPR